MINLNICKDHQVFYHLQVTGYDNDSQLEGYLLVSTKDYTKFECKSSNLVNTWVVYHKYRIVFEIYDGNDGILEILYGNSEFISFVMIMKASMFSLMVFFGVLNVLRQKKLDMKDFLERNKYLALVGVWALGFYFPVEAFAVFWNNNTVWIIQSLLVTGFLTVFIGTFKVFNTKNLNFEVFLYFLFTFLLAGLNFPYFTSFIPATSKNLQRNPYKIPDFRLLHKADPYNRPIRLYFHITKPSIKVVFFIPIFSNATNSKSLNNILTPNPVTIPSTNPFILHRKPIRVFKPSHRNEQFN